MNESEYKEYIEQLESAVSDYVAQIGDLRGLIKAQVINDICIEDLEADRNKWKRRYEKVVDSIGELYYRYD